MKLVPRVSSKEIFGTKIFNNLIDAHVHARGADESHKGDINSETQAALAGGFSTILVMPNTKPPLTSKEILDVKIQEAESQANCIIGLYAGATDTNSETINELGQYVCALKTYMDNTTGDLKIKSLENLENHFRNWKGPGPICVHAEEDFGSLTKALHMAQKYNQPLHVCHVSTKEEVDLIRKAKEANLPVTCEVTPHHLLLTILDLPYLGNYGKVKPELKSRMDVNYLWKAIEDGVIDVIADDHAPHTKEEKESSNPPSGIPGLETTIPLMLTAVNEGRITLERLVEMISTNPKKIFHLPDNPDTYTKIDLDKKYHLDESELKTKCGHSPYRDHLLTGKVREVCIRGKIVYKDGEVLPYKNREELVIKRYGNN